MKEYIIKEILTTLINQIIDCLFDYLVNVIPLYV